MARSLSHGHVRPRYRERMGGARARKVFTLLVEMRCNSYCVFCGQRQVDEGLVRARRSLGLSMPPTSYGDLRGRYTLVTATDALVAARTEGYTELSLQGGEPTLFPEIVPLVSAARDLGFEHIGLVTNGRKLEDPDFARKLLEAGLDAITFSVLGHDAKTHDDAAIAPGSFGELLLGLRNARAVAASLDRKLTLNINLITTGQTVAHLSEQVGLFSGAGADAASMHLVRFDGLASDPKVVSSLRFDVRDVTKAIDEAWREADRLGFSLHATDIPLCLHPELRPSELEVLERRVHVSQHHFSAAAFEYDADPVGRVKLPPCKGCVLAPSCPRVPPQYLPVDPAEALHVLTPGAIGAKVDAFLAGLDPSIHTSPGRVLETARSLTMLSRIAGATVDLDSSFARLEEALGDLAVLAFARQDTAMVIEAVAARLGLHPPRWPAEVVLRAGTTDITELARAADAVARDRDVSEWRLRFAPGFEIALYGASSDGEEARFTRPRAVLRPVTGLGDRLVLALFLGCLCPTLRQARRVRVTPPTIEVDVGRGWVTAWSLERDSVACLVRGPHAQMDARPGGRIPSV
jgi:MoaA/NifB/PqqE/SkfB family radical SAM enzyme